MNTSAIMDLVNDLEERFSVDQWTAGGVHIWPFLRIKVNFDLYYAYHASTGTRTRTRASRAAGLLKDLVRFGHATLADARMNRRPRRHADVVLVSDGISYAFQNDAWYEKFCDPLIERFTSRGISSLLISPSHTYRIPRHTASFFIQPRLDAVRLRNLLFPVLAPANDTLQREFPAFCSYFEQRGLPPPVPTLDALQRSAGVLQRLCSAYQDIFRKTTPALVCIVSYYSVEGMAVNLACRRCGIPSIDLQHGLQGDLHVAYARWKRVPADGYELLPSHFWVWDGSDAKTIEQWNAPVARWHRPIIGGNLWLNEWLDGHDGFLAAYDRRMMDACRRFPGKPHVLVTLQFNLADEGTLGPLLAAMRRTQHELRWWVRLHPCMLNDRGAVRSLLAKCGITDAETDLATDLPLYAVLRHMDLHVTHSSSTVIEAALFGIPSVVISSYGAEFFPEQLSTGWAVTAFTEQAIIESLWSQQSARQALQPTRPLPPSPEKAFEELIALTTSDPRIKEDRNAS